MPRLWRRLGLPMRVSNPPEITCEDTALRICGVFAPVNGSRPARSISAGRFNGIVRPGFIADSLRADNELLLPCWLVVNSFMSVGPQKRLLLLRAVVPKI